MQFPKIVAVKAIEKYKLFVRFNDDAKGVYDLSHLAGKGVFKPWDTNNNFFKVFINKESGAVQWPGEIDLDTLNIYAQLTNGEETNKKKRKELLRIIDEGVDVSNFGDASEWQRKTRNQ